MTLLAGFQTMIFHYTGQPDIVLGTDLANRTTVQTEALIGFFVNLLALRADFRVILHLSNCWRACAKWHWEPMLIRMCHSTNLVEELQPERSFSHNPLVQVLFVQQNTPRAAEPLPGLEMVRYPIRRTVESSTWQCS